MSDKLEQSLRAGPAGWATTADAAAGRFRERALSADAVDIAYAVVDSPAGPLLAAATRVGLATLSYAGEETVLNELARRVSPRILEAPSRLDDTRRQLDEYFGGRRHRFELALDWGLVGPFARRVLGFTADIPYGEVRTYREVAAAAGSQRAARAAGNALGSNPLPIIVPCHRVVRSGGGLGGYTGGLDRKRLLLTLEGAIPG